MNIENTFEILSVKPDPENASYLGTVSFVFQPSKFHPLRIIHSVERQDGWHNYVDAEIEGVSVVRVNSSFLRIAKSGNLYVQTPNVDIPWAISTEVAKQAAEIRSEKYGVQREKGYGEERCNV